MYAADEERLRLPDVADAGDESLVEQCVSDFFIAAFTNSTCGFPDVERFAEKIGAKCGDRL